MYEVSGGDILVIMFGDLIVGVQEADNLEECRGPE
jgi:hypothetical protein